MNQKQDAEETKKSLIDAKSLIAGVSSGGITNLLLHPLDSVKTRLQAQGRADHIDHASKSYGFIKETLYGTRNIIRNEGWKALYQGLGSSVLGAGLSWGLYFFM